MLGDADEQDTHANLASSMQDTGALSETISQNLASVLSEINSTLSDVQKWRSQAIKPSSWWRPQPGFSLFSCELP
jgi:hypothetical protein